MTSTSSTPTDWFQQLYQTTTNLPAATATAGRVSDSTVVSTTSSHTAGTNPPSSSTCNYSFAHQLGNLTGGGTNSMISSDSRQAGRSITSTTSTGRGVTKPARRRSRASRKNPTTLLSTDTKNFRAMVQRFTGGGIATASGDHSAVPAGYNNNIMPFMYQQPPGLNFHQQGGGSSGGGRGGGGGGGGGSGSFMMSMGTHFADHTHQMMIPQQQYMFSSAGPGSSTADTSAAVPSRAALIPTLSSHHQMDPHDQSAVVTVTDPSTQVGRPDGGPGYPSTPNSSGRWR